MCQAKVAYMSGVAAARNAQEWAQFELLHCRKRISVFGKEAHGIVAFWW